LKLLRLVTNKVLAPSGIVRLRALDYWWSSSDEHRVLKKLCDKDKVSVDVGANLGTLTYLIARHSSHVYAYEPNPELSCQLRQVFSKTNVTVIQAALSDAPGSTTLKLPSYGGIEMHGLASITQDFNDADAVREFRVPVRRLDDENLANVGFLKIDVEQNEEKVLRGAIALIKAQRPNILLEVTPKLYSQSLLEFLSSVLMLRYRGYFLHDRKLWNIEDYRVDIHNRPEHYGVRGKYVTNVVLSHTPIAETF